MKASHLLLPVIGLALTGCQIGSPPAGKEIMPPEAQERIAPVWSGPHGQGAVVPGWIGTFGDDRLKEITEIAIRVNPDLRAAAARVEASQAAVRVASSALYPRIGGKLIGERQGRELNGDLDLGLAPPDLGGVGIDLGGAGSDTTSIEASTRRWVYGLGLGATWEADVWGRVRSKSAAARSDSLAAEADYEFAVQSIAATAARAYFSVIEAGLQAANAQESLNLYTDYAKLTDVQLQQGFASDFAMGQIKSRMNGAQDMLYAANAGRAQAVRVLDGLLWIFGSGVTQPIFLGGELKAFQDIREAEQRAAVADYTGAAMRAFQEVEDALSNEHYLRLREGVLGNMVDNSSEVVKLGRVKLDQGQADMFTILRLSGENLVARAELIKVRASRLRERTNLHLALGGDFSSRGK